MAGSVPSQGTGSLPAASRRRAGRSRRWPVPGAQQVLLGLVGAAGRAAGASVPSSTAGHRILGSALRAPFFFDCSNHEEWNQFRERFAEFRARFTFEDRESPELLELVQAVLREANDLGRRYEPTFVKWASSWDVFLMCSEKTRFRVPEELQTDFCFYGFAVVQWLGLFGHQHFGSVPGMAEWAHNAHGFLNDASKFNAMHFLESSGWQVKLVEMARALSKAASGNMDYRPARDAALPALGVSIGPARQAPTHSKVPVARKLRAVAISYHTALLREPLTLWLRVLRHRFEVETAIHVLDATAKTPEDIKRLHSHCRFADGAWCASDARLLQLNELFEDTVLACHNGDHKTRHHFITDAEAYFQLFIDVMGNDEQLQTADLLMCGEPVYFCRLLAHFGRPVIGYISTPVSVYVNAADRPRWYQTFYELAMDPLHTFAVTTPVFGEWITYATGIELPVVRPVCLYTDASYWPTRQREVLLLRTVSLFWDSECILNHFADETARMVVGRGGNETPMANPFRFVESVSLSAEERVGYSVFAEFIAAVIYPYAFSQFWFYELYAMGVPLFMPARETLPLFVNQDYAVCPDFEGHRPGHRPHDVHKYSPFDTEDWDAMTYWTAFTDYLLFPHVEYFVSVPELMLKLESGDHRGQSRKMQQAHAEHVGAATTFWLEALERVASFSSSSSAASGEREEAAAERSQGPPPGPLSDQLRDLSTRQPAGGSSSRPDGPPYKANDGDTRQEHPHEYHAQTEALLEASMSGRSGASHWWVQLRRSTSDPEVKLWARSCCTEAFGHRLWLLLGNSTDITEAAECASPEVEDGSQVSVVCWGRGEVLFVEARPDGGHDYQDQGVAVLMLPEVRVLSRD